MATPTGTYFGPTGDHAIDALTSGYYWQLNADRTIDWAIADGFAGEYWQYPADLVQHTGNILHTISYYANIRFNFLGYYATPQVAANAGSELTITLSGTSFFQSSSTWARGFFPKPLSQADYYYGEAGDVYLNIQSQANYLSTYEPGSAGWSVFLHEIGHALGLKHPHDSGGTGRPTLQSLGVAELDNDWVTVMSYQDDFNWNLREWDPMTPMILDVLALQYLYGKNMATNAGDTLLSVGRIDGYGTVWDASGNDTVSAAADSEGWVIILPQWQLSAIVDTKAGLAAPIGDFDLASPTTLFWLAGDIENAVGSNAGDALIGSGGANALNGNGGDDYLIGLGGDDTINGGIGLDTAVYDGAASGFLIQRLINGDFLLADVSGPDGTDTLVDVERLEFSTLQVALDLGANQAGGQTALLLGAVLPGLLGLHPSKQTLTGDVIALFDAGFSMQDLSGAALRLPIWDVLTGQASPSNTDIARYLLTNVVGHAPDGGTLAMAVNALNTESVQGDWLAGLVLSPENAIHIGLVGLATTGLAFL